MEAGIADAAATGAGVGIGDAEATGIGRGDRGD
jgi:hypothetical protein